MLESIACIDSPMEARIKAISALAPWPTPTVSDSTHVNLMSRAMPPALTTCPIKQMTVSTMTNQRPGPLKNVEGDMKAERDKKYRTKKRVGYAVEAVLDLLYKAGARDLLFQKEPREI